MVYCKLDVLVKTVNCKLMIIANEDVLLTTKDGILLTGCTRENSQLQTDDKNKLESYPQG